MFAPSGSKEGKKGGAELGVGLLSLEQPWVPGQQPLGGIVLTLHQSFLGQDSHGINVPPMISSAQTSERAKCKREKKNRCVRLEEI